MNFSNDTNGNETSLFPFDPIIIALDILKRWLLIALIAVFVGVGVYIATDITYVPIYQTTTTYVVTSRGSSATVYNNLSSTSSVASVFTDLLNSSILRKSILAELGTNTFDGTISAAVIPDTNLLDVKVKASDPRTAYTVAKAIVENHEDITYQVVDGVSLEVLMYPSVPQRPINPISADRNMKKMMLYAAIASVAAIAFISYSQNKVRSGKEVRAKLDCDYLGEIPHEKKYRTLAALISHKKTSILISKPATSFHFVETIRKLRHRVEQRMHGGKVLMVTSLLENEGKSTVAVNLAIAMAKKKAKVLLIDYDLRKPACHYLLDRKDIKHTVLDVILGKATAKDALIYDKRSNLYVMLEHRSHNRSGDLVASDRTGELIRWARENFDFVVLDLPPMAEVSDAETMTKFADASLLIVRQNIASAPVINKSIAALEKGKARLIGCVLNNVYSSVFSSGSGHGNRYGYGYGYGKYGAYGRYGYYGAYDPKTAGNNAKMNPDQ